MKINQQILLRGWQQKGFREWLNNDLKGIFSVVTGGGKTIFGIYCLSYLFENDLTDSVFIVVPTKTLQDQWVSNILISTNCLKEEISLNRKKLSKINILTNISTQKIPFEKLNLRYSIVLDECHRYGTSNNLNFLTYPYVSKIGLTATLERKYDSGVNDILVPNIGKIIYNYSIKEALKDGVVEKYKMIYLRTHLNQEEEYSYNKMSKQISKLYKMLLQEKDSSVRQIIKKSLEFLLFKRSRLVNESEQRKFVATRLILNNIKRKKIIFCESIKQTEEIKELCKSNGLSTAVYHSKMKQSDRISVLNDFQSDYYHTLIGCKALDEGFDVPNIDFGIIVSQTKTSRQRIQRLGRTIRKFKDKEQPIIYTLYSTEDEYSVLYEEQFNNSNIEVEWMEVN
jgi:superfamily II DNA or RNA helicase